MTITVTGSKYSSTVQSVGTFTLTVPSTTTFLSADFGSATVSKQRIVALHDASTNVLLGIAFVRRYVSSQVLELQSQFYQPWDGATVTQVVGQKVNVSKNFADIATTGLTISYNNIQISDAVTFGSGTNQADTCFYDEDYFIQFGVGATTVSQFPIAFSSGVIVFGHLQDYASESITGDVFWTWAGVRGDIRNQWLITGTNCNFIHYGGGIRVTNDVYTSAGPAVSPALILFHKFTYDASISANAVFSNPSKAIVRSCIGAGKDGDIVLRWKNGTIQGGSFRMSPSAGYYAIFGDDAAGTYVIGAEPSKRLIITNIGSNSNTSGASLWRCGNLANAQTVNFTNVISPVRSATNIGVDNPLTVLNYYYSDSITNVLSGSQAAIWRTIDNMIVDSIASTGTVWSPSVQHDKWAGKIRQSGFPITQWKYRIRKYGYSEVLQTVNASTYPLGNYTSDNVSFSGSVIQTPDTKQTADASTMTGVSLNYSTTALTVSSSHTIEDVNNYIKYSLRQNLVQDDFSSYAGTALSIGSWSLSGLEYLSTSTLFNTISSTNAITAAGAFNNISVTGNVSQATPTNLTGVTITGNLTYNTNTPVTITLTNCTITGTVSNSGTGAVTVTKASTTIGTAGTNVITQQFATLAVTNIVANSRLLIRRTDTNTALVNTLVTGNLYSYTYPYLADIPIEIILRNASGSPAYQEFRTTSALTVTSSSIAANQVSDQ